MSTIKSGSYKAAFGTVRKPAVRNASKPVPASSESKKQTKYILIEGNEADLKYFEEASKKLGMSTKAYLKKLYGKNQDGPIDVTIVKQMNPNETLLKCVQYDRAPLQEVDQALKNVMAKKIGEDSAQIQILNINQVGPKSLPTPPKTPPRQIYTMDITMNEKSFITNDHFSLTLAEIKRAKNRSPVHHETMDEIDMDRMHPSNIREPVQRSVSMEPEFMKKHAGNRHHTVEAVRNACGAISQDPSIRSIHNVTAGWTKNSTPRSKSSPVDKGTKYPRSEESNRFFRMLEDLQRDPFGLARDADLAGVKSAQQGDSGFSSPENENGKKTVGGQHAKKPSTDSAIHSTPTKQKNLNPAAKEFLSLKKIFPNANITVEGPSLLACAPVAADLLPMQPEASKEYDSISMPPLLTYFFENSGERAKKDNGELPLPHPAVNTGIRPPPGLPIPPAAYSLPPPSGADPFSIPPLPALVNMAPPPGLGFPPLFARLPSPVQRFPVMAQQMPPTMQQQMPPVNPQQMRHPVPHQMPPIMHQQMHMPPAMPPFAMPPSMMPPPTMPAPTMQPAQAMPPTGPFGPHVAAPPYPSTGPSGFPGPVRKPRLPNTVGQQQYEAWIEWKKAVNPAYAMECKARQARRAQRQLNNNYKYRA